MSTTSPASQNARAAPAKARVRVWAVLGSLLVWLLWQLAFWGVVHLTERTARPVALDERDEIRYKLLDAAGRSIDPAGELRVAKRDGLEGFTLSTISADKATKVLFVVPFEVTEPLRPQALFLAIREQISGIRLNGVWIEASEPVAQLEGLVTSEPGYYSLPSEHLRQGDNLLEVEKDVVGFDTALAEFAIGPADSLAEAYRWKRALLIDVALIGEGVLFFALLLCLTVNWPSEDRPRIRALVLLLGSCAAGTWFLTFGPPVDLGFYAGVALWVQINLAISIAITIYLLFDFGLSAAKVKRVSRWWPVPVGLFLLAFGAGLAFDRETERSLLFFLVFSGYRCVALVGLVGPILIAWALWRDRGARWFERSVLAFCISALGMDRVGSIYDLHSPFDASLPLTLPWSPIIGALLGLSMVFALAREAAQARRTVLDANRVLTETLSQRETELAASYAERTQIQRRAAMLEERGRIVRDMHDGIGGQLVSLQMRVQAQQIDPGSLAAALEDSLADLRLIVDSLDTAEDGLSDALVAFERRVRQQAQAVGCRIQARHDLAQLDDRYGARITLQVLRILQEAVTNALRHGKASAIRLEAGPAADGGILLQLEDNGCGIEPDAAPGHGLVNMRHRAQSIGAELSIQAAQSGSGTCVRLRLPARQ